MMNWLLHPDQYEIRAAKADDAAAIFVVQAAIDPVDAGQLAAWTEELEEGLESGGLAWVVAHGRRLAGYATIDPVPGLPGVYDLAGGIVPARRRHGLGTRLLRHVQAAAAGKNIRHLSCRVDDLAEGTAVFLLRCGFYMEHEECRLELPATADLPPVSDDPPGALLSFPRQRIPGEFCRLYDESFAGQPWSQPYIEDEVAAMLAQPEDILFLVLDGRPIGVVWYELTPDGRGRIEPIGIAPSCQGRGYGRRLMLAALHRLRRRGATVIEISLWRDNTVAMHLYKSLGFAESARWYYLVCDLS